MPQKLLGAVSFVGEHWKKTLTLLPISDKLHLKVLFEDAGLDLQEVDIARHVPFLLGHGGRLGLGEACPCKQQATLSEGLGLQCDR